VPDEVSEITAGAHRYVNDMTQDLSAQSLRELLVNHVAILNEITKRGLTRTRGSLAGELGERITLAAYGGELSTAGMKSIDLVDGDRRSIQVKTRALEPGVNRIFAFSSFDFDVLVAILIDATTFEIQWAKELTSAEATAIARYRVPSRDWAIATSKVKRTGIDITERLRMAYSELDGRDHASRLEP
jgi:hypothetical protein